MSYKKYIKQIIVSGVHKFMPQYELVRKTTLESCVIRDGIPHYLQFDSSLFSRKIIQYVNQMHVSNFEYLFSASCGTGNIYNSVYACLALSLVGELDGYTKSEKKAWAAYFDSFQNSSSGIYEDKRITNELFYEIDYWGARHLVPHILMAYRALGEGPKYAFKWVEPYYDLAYLKKWLDDTDWNSAISDSNDIDNKIMNIGCVLQYQRDFENNKQASVAIDFIKQYLKSKINPDTGLWGVYDVENRRDLCRMVQFAYHIMRLFIYDNERFDNISRIIDLILISQNQYGGFGAELHSSACEDIDAIDILIYFSKFTEYRAEDVKLSLQRAMIYILANQNQDGGFVFRRDESLKYGSCESMYAQQNESHLFATWFRTLSIAYICSKLNITHSFKIKSCPGY